MSAHRWKIATEEEEFRQIFRLTYKTFVEEIPQHPANGDGILVDKFHGENIYLIALREERVVGMMALRPNRPFSLDSKVPDLDSYLPPHQKVVEIRLLSVDPSERGGTVLQGLLRLLMEVNREKQWDLAVISGTTRQLKLYRHMGFVPFGPLTGTEGAHYQPMYVSLDQFKENTGRITTQTAEPATGVISFLPGPVQMAPEVREAFALPPAYHRCAEFAGIMTRCQDKLTALLSCRHAIIALGSGTLANEMVAAHLSTLGQRGLILANGEFGERLCRLAKRHGLEVSSLIEPWGACFPLPRLVAELATGNFGWLWMAACETSTGMKNEMAPVEELCRRHGVKFCLDGISAVGAYPLSLANVYLASSASGKALGSFPGLALVFFNHPIPVAENLPGYLDIGEYHAHGSTPFTHSSNLLRALDKALDRFSNPGAEFLRKERLSCLLREELARRSIPVLVRAEASSPCVFTLPLSLGTESLAVAERLRRKGMLVAAESAYLAQRNWLQICLMGDLREDDILRLMANWEAAAEGARSSA